MHINDTIESKAEAFPSREQTQVKENCRGFEKSKRMIQSHETPK